MICLQDIHGYSVIYVKNSGNLNLKGWIGYRSFVTKEKWTNWQTVTGRISSDPHTINKYAPLVTGKNTYAYTFHKRKAGEVTPYTKAWSTGSFRLVENLSDEALIEVVSVYGVHKTIEEQVRHLFPTAKIYKNRKS